MITNAGGADLLEADDVNREVDLDEEEDSNTTTGIENIARPSTGDGYFYTLNGVRVDKPTKKGIYIYNGKKIVIR